MNNRDISAPNLTTTVVLLPSSLTESFELVLGRIVDLTAQNEHITIFACNGAVKGCVSNYLCLETVCRHCQRVRNQALKECGIKAEIIFLDSFFDGIKIKKSNKIYNEIEVSVNSTILTFYRRDIESFSRNILHKMIYTRLVKALNKHSLFVYSALVNYLKLFNIAKIEFFNGRIIPTRAAMLAARDMHCDFGVLEVTGRDRHITVTVNDSVHNINSNQEKLLKFLSQPNINLQAGVLFFESRRKGEETDHKSFTVNQEYGQLKRRVKPMLAIFTSSADELKVAGSQWFTTASQNPVDFIADLATKVHRDFDIVVRMHPNQAGDKTGAASEMIKVLSAIGNIELIEPTSRVSSYELLDMAEAVLTFGSTIGLEATYWGKPSILAGRAVWERQNIAYRVDTSDEAAVLLATRPIPRSRGEAIAVGAYFIAGAGQPGSLAWQHNGVTGFSVNGRSFIDLKRASLAYWFTRLVDRFLRVY